MRSLLALIAGYFLDLIVGDPHSITHPVVIIGKEISFLERLLRRVFPKNRAGERTAGAVLWVIVALSAAVVPTVVLYVFNAVNPYLAFFAESIMCWQCLATKSLGKESMRVYSALREKDILKARYAVSMIVGRDTDRLDADGICRAAVETVAENTSDGVVAPMLCLAIGGAPLGFLYKAINTMDSMIGYIDPPYTNIGFFAAKADDAANFIPSRLSAILMLLCGGILKLDVKRGIRIFLRDRFNHKSPNSAQTEAACAGLLGIRLAGDACYGGVLHKKKFIGDDARPIEKEDISRVCGLLYAVSATAMFVVSAIKFIGICVL